MDALGTAVFGPISLAPGVPLTVVCVDAEGGRLVALELDFDVTALGSPIVVETARVRGDGVYATSAPIHDLHPDRQHCFAARVHVQATTEPTYGRVLKLARVQGVYGLSDGLEVVLGEAAPWLALRLTAPTACTVSGTLLLGE